MQAESIVPPPSNRKFKDSIRAKLFASFVLMTGAVLAICFASVLALNSKRFRQELPRLENDLRSAIFAKGIRLISNHANVLATLAEDGNISAIEEILGNLIGSDSNLVYGIYMDSDGRHAAYRNRFDSTLLNPRNPLSDSMNIWAAGIEEASHRALNINGTEVFEFAAPVRSGARDLGRIRVGLTARHLQAILHRATDASREAHRATIFIFSAIAVVTCLLAVLASGYQAKRITTPITALTVSASRMARGDYGAEVKAVGTDEISILANAFEGMRLKIREYMVDLQMLVDNKVRQVRDILENIDQGIFSFDLNLRINEDCSLKAKAILRVEEMAGRTLAEVLKLDAQQERLFRDWVEIAREGHARLRWHKVSRLAPVRELRIHDGGSGRHLRLEYRKILDKQDRLSGIMVFVQDVTESRKIERRLLEEKTRHEHRVRTILGVASHTQETIADFLRDSSGRLQAIRKRLEAARDNLPEMDRESASALEKTFRDCHTVKGNAGAFGFDALTQSAQDLETALEIGEPEKGLGGNRALLPEMIRLVSVMSEETEKIREIHVLISGSSEDVSVRLPERKVARIREMAETVGNQVMTPEMLILVENCKRLSYRSLASLSRKYQDLVARAAFKLGKSVEFSISPRNVEVDPGALFRVDEALTHLFRNAVAHGIEDLEFRLRLGKGPGKVDLSYARVSGAHIFMVRDDGTGVDSEALAEKAVEKGILSREAVSRMGDKEKLNLLFHPGLCATAAADTLSGRGLGMAIANDSLRALGGSLAVETKPGSGTCFTLTIPA